MEPAEIQALSERVFALLQSKLGARGSTAEIERYLNEIDVAAERSRRRYNKMAAIAGQFILVTAIAVSVLVWRGYV